MRVGRRRKLSGFTRGQSTKSAEDTKASNSLLTLRNVNVNEINVNLYSNNIRTRFCYVLLCNVYLAFFQLLMWFIHPHSTGLLYWHCQGLGARKVSRKDFGHYNDVMMSAMASPITSPRNIYSTVYSGGDKKNAKALCQWPLCGEFTGDRWIPNTNGH